MKKIIVTLLLFIALKSFSQGGFVTPNFSYGNIQKRISIDSTIFLPTGCGSASLQAYNLHKAALFFDSCNHIVWWYDPAINSWDTLNKAGGGGGGANNYTTSI